MMNCEDGTTNEVVNLNHSKAMNYLTCFICLIPIHPENTTEEEIMIWLPDIIEILLKYSCNNLVVMLIIRLLSEVSTNFKGFNFSRYHETLQYLLSKEILDNKLSASNPSNESAILKHYAQLIVNTYRSINHQRKCPEYKNLEIKSIFAYFEPMMHPEHSFKCPSLIYLGFYITKALCGRVRKEKKESDINPELINNYEFLSNEDIKHFMSIIKPSLELAMQGNIMLPYISATLKNLVSLDCDEILSMYMLKNFNKLSELVNIKFMTLINDVIVGVLISDTDNSQYKYEFIQNTIEYLLEQTKMLNESVLK